MKVLSALLALTMQFSVVAPAFAKSLTSEQKAFLRQAYEQAKQQPVMAEPMISNTTGVAKWTVMVYLNGASNLAPDMARIIKDAERSGSTPDVQVVAHMTRTKDGYKKGGYVRPLSPAGIQTPEDTRSGSERLRVKYDPDNSQITSISEAAHGDPGKMETLIDFIKWAKKARPARHYMLMIYGHGSGMLGTSASDAAGGGSNISIPELQHALRLTGGVDVLFFYSCLMQMVEVSARLQDEAKVIVGSEASMVSSLPFKDMFREIKYCGDAGAEEMGRVVFKSVAKNDPRVGGGTQAIFTLSMVKPSGLKKLIPAINAYAEAVMSENDLASAQFARDNVLRVGPPGGDIPQGHPFNDYADLLDFVQLQANASSSGKVRAAAQNLLDVAQSDYILNVAQDRTPASAFSNGVSVYLPRKDANMLPPAVYSGNPIGASKWGALIVWMNLARDPHGATPEQLDKMDRKAKADQARKDAEEESAMRALDQEEIARNPTRAYMDELQRQDAYKKRQDLEKMSREAARMQNR